MIIRPRYSFIAALTVAFGAMGSAALASPDTGADGGASGFNFKTIDEEPADAAAGGSSGFNFAIPTDAPEDTGIGLGNVDVPLGDADEGLVSYETSIALPEDESE